MKNKRKIIDYIIMGVLLFVFCFSAYKLISRHLEYIRGVNEYDEASEIIGTKDLDEEVENLDSNELPKKSLDKLKKLDVSKLSDKNSDVNGWIVVPKTKINYPIMKGKDNNFYLTYTWKKEYNWMGSIFMDFRCSEDMNDFNTIIYGHNLRNKIMFSSILKYENQDFLDEHKYVYVAMKDELRKYQVFAAYEADVKGHVYDFARQDKGNFIKASLDQSKVSTDIKPVEDDKILTLSTCTGRGYDTRWVVQAVLIDTL